MPINKNLWSISFVCVTGGGGLILLTLTYLMVDVYKVWSGMFPPILLLLTRYPSPLMTNHYAGFPFRQMGMNSILLYVGHSLLGGYFPFR
jgi:heparan-alpha-glucosaminide N-acetyltransferase